MGKPPSLRSEPLPSRCPVPATAVLRLDGSRGWPPHRGMSPLHRGRRCGGKSTFVIGTKQVQTYGMTLGE
jgi:hypothetical protein